VVCFLEAVPLLMSVVFMLLFFLFVFGVAATELFADVFHHQCVDVDGDFEPPGYEAPDEYGCGFRQCPTNYTCEVSQQGWLWPALQSLQPALLYSCHLSRSGQHWIAYPCPAAMHFASCTRRPSWLDTASDAMGASVGCPIPAHARPQPPYVTASSCCCFSCCCWWWWWCW
jgi:hypothetical protein